MHKNIGHPHVANVKVLPFSISHQVSINVTNHQYLFCISKFVSELPT